MITYAYSGGSGGITCADGTTATLKRDTPDSSTPWTYTHAENGSAWTTTVKDPANNSTTYEFSGIYERQRSNPLETVTTCYNGDASNCPTAAVTPPITQRAVTVAVGSLQSKINTSYNTYGLPTETDEYACAGAPGGLVRRTTISYTGCGVTNANVVNRRCTIQVYDGAGHLAAQTSNTYDGNGNLLSVARTTQGTTTISQSFTPMSNGLVQKSTDFNGNTTSYSYNDCNASLPDSVTPPLIPGSNLAWDSNGGVVTEATDANSHATTFGYDSMYRLTSTTYPDNGSTSITYTSAQLRDVYTALSGSASILDLLKRTHYGTSTPP